MVQDRLFQKAISVLLIAGFEVSERCAIRPRSFDLIAKKGGLLLIIKVSSPIDNVSEDIARDLDLIAGHLDGSPLIIGGRARDTDLERGAVYLRYGIIAINPETLYDYLVDGVPPLVYASPGGLYVNINGDVLRGLREQKNMSLGDLGAVLGVSRRTISKYESGMGTTLEIAIKIEEVFDSGVIESIDLLKYTSHFAGKPQERLPVLALAVLEQIGLELHALRRAPFQVLAIFRGEMILTGYGTAEKVVKRAGLIGNLSAITHTHAMCVATDGPIRKKIGQTLIIGEEELHGIEDGEELIELFD